MDGAVKHRGLSLIEVLVTIGLVTMLTSIALPVVGSIRTSARAAQCATQLRQLAFAATQYANTHGAYPIATRAELNNGVHEIHNWDWVTRVDGTVLGPGALFEYADRPDDVFQCPTYHGPANAGDPATGYNYNTTYIGGEGPLTIPGWAFVRPSAIPAQCRRMSTCAMFGCAGRANGTNKYMRAPENTIEGSLPQVYAGAQAYHYGGKTNVAKLDGSVSRVGDPFMGIHATPELVETYLTYPKHGFLSDDDAAYRPW